MYRIHYTVVARVNSILRHSSSVSTLCELFNNCITVNRRFATMADSGVIAGKKAAAYKAVDDWVKVCEIIIMNEGLLLDY